MVTPWYGHQAPAALLPMYLFPNGTHRPQTHPAEVLCNQRPLKWTSAGVQSAPRNLFRSLDSKCGRLLEEGSASWSVGCTPAPDDLALCTPPPPLSC